MKNEEILKKLRDAKDYVSGQELCEYYGVSRTAIWKAIKQLEKDGYVIEAQNNKGYRLVEENDSHIFSKVEIESHLDTQWVGRKLVFHKETGSTNLDAKALAEQGEAVFLKIHVLQGGHGVLYGIGGIACGTQILADAARPPQLAHTLLGAASGRAVLADVAVVG